MSLNIPHALQEELFQCYHPKLGKCVHFSNELKSNIDYESVYLYHLTVTFH